MYTNLRYVTKDNDRFVELTIMADDGAITQTTRPMDDKGVADAVAAFAKGDIDANQLAKALEPKSDDGVRRHVAESVGAKLRRVTHRITTDGNHVFINNDTFGMARLDVTLEDHLVRLIREHADERDWASWARFAERLYDNADEQIRAQLFRWLKAQGWLCVDDDGRLVGYRGCADENGTPTSVSHGSAYVNGDLVNGSIPNPVGAIVEMPRSQVTADPAVGCAAGLHVGTFSYARGWAPNGGWLLKVAVRPEDIVSVPFECESSKLRCCRFEVLEAEKLEFIPDESDYEEDMTYGSVDDDPDDDPDTDDDGDDGIGYVTGVGMTVLFH